MDNNNEKAVIPVNNIPTNTDNQTDQFIPDWANDLGKELGIYVRDVLNKQSISTTLISDEDKVNVNFGLSRLAEVSKGLFTENELIFMYVVGIKNLMDTSAELQQTKQLLQFFSGMATSMGDENNNEQ